MKQTVIEYVLERIADLGIRDIFGVAGDYAFPIEDAICASTTLRWVGNCNELNAAYAADGYARVNGVAALATTFGVGELSALNGIAGSYAENLPVIHLVGMPASAVQNKRRLVHHTLGDGDFSVFYKMSQGVVCAHALLTPDNCIAETERVIACALRERRPVYLGIASDHAEMPVTGEAISLPTPKSDPLALDAALTAIHQRLSHCRSACILPGVIVARRGLREEVTRLAERSGLPFATMFMDKSVLDESLPNYLGMYDGQLMNEPVREFVENCDCVLGIGVVMTDFNSGCFTARLAVENTINIHSESVDVGEVSFPNVFMKDVLDGLNRQIRPMQVNAPQATGCGKPEIPASGEISVGYLYPRLEQMLKSDDIIIAETGTCSMGLGFARLPTNVQFHNQTLWGSIGWATPAAFGAAVAAPQRRVILLTGEGSHQLTVQEISQFGRMGLKPIILVLNNNGYLIERLLCKQPEASYNNLAGWEYSKLPEALGCKQWFCCRVTRCDELDDALLQAENAQHGSYIEIVTGRYEAPELATKLHQSLTALYSA